MRSGGTDAPAAETVVMDPAWLRFGAWIICPLLGVGLALLLTSLSGWLASTSWAPWQGLFELVASVPDPWGATGAAGLGVLAGLGLALFLAVDSLAVTVTAEGVTLKRRGTVQHFERAPVSAVFLDRNTLEKQLVLLDRSGGELAREKSDASDAALRDAFLAYTYPWNEGDPHEGEYRMWVPNTPDLESGANAVFAARQRALDKDKKGDVAALRTELANLGLVVRDKKKRQYWRHTSNGSD